MTNSSNRMKKLEIALFIWTVLNVAIGAWVLLTGQLQIFGSGLAVWLPLLIGLPAAGFLLYRLLRPTRAILLFGTLFWALQTVSVQFPDALYKFRLGISFDFRLTDNPNYVVAINIFAIVVVVLFAIAAADRPASSSQVATA